MDVCIAEALLEQARRFPERRELAARWLERAEPRARYNLELIKTTGESLLRRLSRDAELEGTPAKSA